MIAHLSSKNKASGLSSQHILEGGYKLFHDIKIHDCRNYTKRHSRETETYSSSFLEEPPLIKFGLSLFCVIFQHSGLKPPSLRMVICYTQNIMNLFSISFSAIFTEIFEMMSD